MAYIGGVVGATIAVSMADAIKASGTIVSVEPEVFLQLLDKIEEPLIVTATGGVVNKNFQYLVSYKGLAFFTKSSEKLPLPVKTELISAKNISIPDI